MDYENRLARLKEQYHDIKSSSARRDLDKIWKNCADLHREIDKELVECRRMRKLTPRYYRLVKQLNATIETLDKHITFARLLY